MWCSGVLSPRPFPCSSLYLAFIRTTSRQVTHLGACLISLGDFRTEGPLYAHLNATKIGHQARDKRVICSFFVCIVLLNTLKILFVLICLLCFDSRKADGECTGFLPIIALNSNTIKYTVSSHDYQVTNQFCFNLVYLNYHTSWSVSLKKYVERLLLSADNCLQFMPWKGESAQMNPDKISYKTNKNQHAEMPAVIALFCHKRSVGQSNHVVVFFSLWKNLAFIFVSQWYSCPDFGMISKYNPFESQEQYTSSKPLSWFISSFDSFSVSPCSLVKSIISSKTADKYIPHLFWEMRLVCMLNKEQKAQSQDTCWDIIFSLLKYHRWNDNVEIFLPWGRQTPVVA